MEAENSVCESCRYYVRYYRIRNTKYSYAGCGYCSHHYMTWRERRTIPNIKQCENWEPEALRNAERRETIKEAIRAMRKQLSDIALMLKDDGE